MERMNEPFSAMMVPRGTLIAAGACAVIVCSGRGDADHGECSTWNASLSLVAPAAPYAVSNGGLLEGGNCIHNRLYDERAVQPLLLEG